MNDAVHKTIDIAAPPARVWKVITDPDMIKQWLSDTGITVQSDWQAGAPILFLGKWHGISLDGKGVILDLDPEKRFLYSHWSRLSKLPDTPENYSIIEFCLQADNGSTLLSVTQSNLKNEATYGHVNYYWNITLGIIKRLAEEASHS